MERYRRPAWVKNTTIKMLIIPTNGSMSCPVIRTPHRADRGHNHRSHSPSVSFLTPGCRSCKMLAYGVLTFSVIGFGGKFAKRTIWNSGGQAFWGKCLKINDIGYGRLQIIELVAGPQLLLVLVAAALIRCRVGNSRCWYSFVVEDKNI